MAYLFVTEFVVRSSKEGKGSAQHRAALEALQAQYEKELAAYGQRESDMLYDRLRSIRSSAVQDIKRRFDSPLTSLEEEGDKQIGKLGKYFDRASNDKKKSIDDKLNGADALVEAAVKDVKAVSTNIAVEVENYRVSVRESQDKAIETAVAAIRDFASSAKEDLLTQWTELDDAVPSDAKREFLHTLCGRQAAKIGSLQACRRSKRTNKSGSRNSSRCRSRPLCPSSTSMACLTKSKKAPLAARRLSNRSL